MESKKLANILHSKWRQANKPNKKRSQTYSNNYRNFVNYEGSSRAARYRDDSDRNVANLSKHSFTKNIPKY